MLWAKPISSFLQPDVLGNTQLENTILSSFFRLSLLPELRLGCKELYSHGPVSPEGAGPVSPLLQCVLPLMGSPTTSLSDTAHTRAPTQALVSRPGCWCPFEWRLGWWLPGGQAGPTGTCGVTGLLSECKGGVPPGPSWPEAQMPAWEPAVQLGVRTGVVCWAASAPGRARVCLPMEPWALTVRLLCCVCVSAAIYRLTAVVARDFCLFQ